MGAYDVVGNGIQIKSTPEPALTHYTLHSVIDLPDGLHLSSEGAFIVEACTITAIFELYDDQGHRRDVQVYDKWGNVLDLGKLIENNNPVLQAIQYTIRHIDPEEDDPLDQLED